MNEWAEWLGDVSQQPWYEQKYWNRFLNREDPSMQRKENFWTGTYWTDPSYQWGESWEPTYWQWAEAPGAPRLYSQEYKDFVKNMMRITQQQWQAAQPAPGTGGEETGGEEETGEEEAPWETDLPETIETFPEVIEWWQKEGFNTYADWYAARVQPYIDMMNDLISGGLPELDTEALGDIYGNMGTLTEQIASPQDTWGEEARQWTAEGLGFENAQEYQDWLRRERELTPSQAEGLSPELRQAYEKQFRQSQREQLEQSRKQAEQIFGASGASLGRMALAMDEANRAFADDQATFQAQMMTQDYAMRQAEVERRGRQLLEMIDRGEASYQDYIDNQMQGVSTALATYYQQANLMLDVYTTEWQGIQNQAQLILDTAALSMGADEHVMKMTAEAYATILQPWLDAQTWTLTEQQIESIQAAMDQGNWSLVVQLIVGLADAVFPG